MTALEAIELLSDLARNMCGGLEDPAANLADVNAAERTLRRACGLPVPGRRPVKLKIHNGFPMVEVASGGYTTCETHGEVEAGLVCLQCVAEAT